jgi:iron complex outermembrane receptor protein
MLTGVPFDASGTRLLRLPKFSGSVTASYDIPVQSGLIQTSATYSFKSAYDFDFVLTKNTKNLRQRGYGLLSGVISYAPDGDRWKVSVYGANILDKKYTNTRQTISTGTFWGYGDPRTYGVRVEANF